MKTLFTFTIMLFSSFIKGQIDTPINQYNSKGEKIGLWKTVDEFEGDSIKVFSYYRNGLLDSEVFTNYMNGNPHSTLPYRLGKRQGKAKFYYKNGAIADIFIYKNDSAIFHVKFTPSGQIFQESEGSKMIQYKNGRPDID